MWTGRSRQLGWGLGVLVLAWGGGVWADCAVGAELQSAVSGNTVEVCFTRSSTSPMLREDASGALVQLSSFQGTFDGGSDLSSNTCFLDECVAPGSYRYGFATPYTCSDKGCGSDVPYWTEATVTGTLPSGCLWSSGNSAPVASTDAAPWPSDGGQFLSCSGGGQGGCSSASAVFGLDGGLLLVSVGVLALRRRRG